MEIYINVHCVTKFIAYGIYIRILNRYVYLRRMIAPSLPAGEGCLFIVSNHAYHLSW
nr:MAG TPA: hypothetical protein [Caudoviricetes sp.]